MKKFTYAFLVSLSLTIVVTSCTKNKINEPVIKNFKEVKGKWRWIYTYIDLPLSYSNPITPANSGATESMEYTIANNWRKVFNNIVVDSGTFSLEHNIYTSPSNEVFRYDQISYKRNNAYLGEDYYRMQNDTLVFDPGIRNFWTSLNVRNVGGTKWFVKE